MLHLHALNRDILEIQSTYVSLKYCIEFQYSQFVFLFTILRSITCNDVRSILRTLPLLTLLLLLSAGKARETHLLMAEVPLNSIYLPFLCVVLNVR